MRGKDQRLPENHGKQHKKESRKVDRTEFRIRIDDFQQAIAKNTDQFYIFILGRNTNKFLNLNL
jgi:hypothetical protein